MVNMKSLANNSSLILIFLILFSIGCSDNEDMNNLESNIESTLFDDIDCKDFFDPSEYSAYCGSNAFDFIAFGSSARLTNGCDYNVALNRVLLFAFGINVRESIDAARGAVENTTITGGFNDTNQSEKMISNVGDGARIISYVNEDGVSNLHLIASYSNVYISISNHHSETNDPCTHNEDDIIKFAKEIISNL